MVTHEEIRLKRLDDVKNLLNAGKEKEHIISKCCLLWGCSRRAMLEYIKVVKNS